MKVLILDHYYEGFLSHFRNSQTDLDSLDFESYRDRLMRQRFGSSDSFSYHLKQGGWEAEEVVCNDHIFLLKLANHLRFKIKALPAMPTKILNRYFGWDWRFPVLKEVVRKIRPDIILIQERNILTDPMIHELKQFTRSVVCFVGSEPLAHRTFKSVDLMLSCLKSFVSRFRSQGLDAEYFRLCVDERFAEEFPAKTNRSIPISFVGGITKLHKKRAEFFEPIAENFSLSWYGYTDGPFNQIPFLKKSLKGQAWASDMYRILSDSKITLNCHVDIAGNEAANMRMFESTLMKACLVTDGRSAVQDFFEPNTEVMAFDTKHELIEAVNFLIKNPDEQSRIAENGFRRTMRDHTYAVRIPEFMKIVRGRLQ